MAANSLKINFRKLFLTLINHKLNFVKCQSVSVMTGPPSFLMQLTIIWSAVLSSNYCLYGFNATRLQKKISKLLDTFVLMVLFEILTRYPYIDSSHWLREAIQWIIDNVFREKWMFEKFSTLSSGTFLLVFACICCCFHSNKICCDVMSITYA